MLHENRFLAGNLLILVRVEPSDAEDYFQWCLTVGLEITVTRRQQTSPATGEQRASRPWATDRGIPSGTPPRGATPGHSPTP